MARSSHVDFENGHIAQNILGTALPMLVAQVLNLLYNIVDRIYIGRLPEIGTAALGAVGLCFPVIILVTAFTNMFGLGGSPLFSMEMGRGNHRKAGAILNSSFRLEILSAVLLTIIVEALAGPILLAFGAVESQLQYAEPYLRLYMIGTIFSMVATGMNAFINAQGYSLIGMLTVVIGAAANIVLDPVFMFGLSLGVAGAAIATVISQALSAVFVLWFLLGPKNAYPLTRPGRRARMPAEGSGNRPVPAVPANKPEDRSAPAEENGVGEKEDGQAGRLFPYAGQIAALGTAPFIMQVTNSLVSMVCNSVLMRFGGELYVSVMTIVNSVRQVVDTPVMALTEGSSPTLSFNYGARRAGNVRKAIGIMTVLAIGYTLLMWLFIEWQPRFLVGIFTDDPVLQQECLRPLHLYFLAFICQSFQYSGQTVFKALGKKKRAIFFSLFRKVVMVVPLTLLLPYAAGLGTDGVFLAEPISNVIGGLACFITMLVTILPELAGMERNKKTGGRL